MAILDEGKTTIVEVLDGDIALFQTYDDQSGVIFEIGFANKGDIEGGRKVIIDLTRLSTIEAMLEVLTEAHKRLAEFNNLNSKPM